VIAAATTRVLGPGLVGSLRYEFLMAARRRTLWVATIPLLLLAWALAATSPGLNHVPTASGQVGAWATAMNLLVTLGVAVALTDRFARTRRRGLGEVLDTTTAGPTRRMLGTLLGALTVALAPTAVGMLVLGGYFALTRGAVTALGWAVLAFVVIIVPAALLATTFAATLGLLLPVPLARVVVVLAWVWATIWNRQILPIPTLSGTLLSPLGDYPAAGWLHAPPFAANRPDSWISPPLSAPNAALSVLALLVLTGVLFTCARALRTLRP